MISKDLLGCATSRNKGTCDNRLNIRRDALEASVLGGLRTHLMDPELFKEFCDEFMPARPFGEPVADQWALCVA
ncbi:hypothetical protein GGD65_005282 [Bradyrhizobium sp. CIR18]|nr:hypothetical protein [Bradyrhizobium sp. CIR18]